MVLVFLQSSAPNASSPGRKASLMNSLKFQTPASLGILQYGLDLLHDAWAPLASVLTLRLSPSPNLHHNVSSSTLPMAHCYWQVLSLHCWLAKALLQWKSCCYLTISSVSYHCSHYHSFIHSFTQQNICVWNVQVPSSVLHVVIYLICKFIKSSNQPIEVDIINM